MSTNKVLEAIRLKKEAEAARKASYIRPDKPEEGKHLYRLLPSWRIEADGTRSGQFWHDFGMHYVRGAAGDKPVAYICTHDTFDKPCDLCSAIYQASQSASNEDEVKFYKDMRSTRRMLVNILHLSGKKEDALKPKLMELPQKVFEQIAEMFDEYGDITDLKSGKNFYITKEGSGLQTRYSVMVAGKDFSVPEAVLKDLHDIDAVVKQEDEAKKKAALDKLAIAVGLLPAGTSSVGSLAAPRAARVLDDEDDAPFDVSSLGETQAVSDSELDDLLASMG